MIKSIFRAILKSFAWIIIPISCYLFTLSLDSYEEAGSHLTPYSVSVRGYTRKGGTYVNPYHRRPRGGVPHDRPYENERSLLILGMTALVIVSVVTVRLLTRKIYYLIHFKKQNYQKYIEKEAKEKRQVSNVFIQSKKSTFTFYRFRLWHFIIIVLLSFSMFLVYKYEINRPNNWEGLNKFRSKYYLEGEATNVTFNKTSKIILEITQLNHPAYNCKGGFDEINQFGKFDLLGKYFVTDDSTSSVDFVFDGTINLGNNPASGFAPNTRAPIRLLITILSDSAVGRYYIYPFPNSAFWDQQQKGLIKLNIKTNP